MIFKIIFNFQTFVDLDRSKNHLNERFEDDILKPVIDK